MISTIQMPPQTAQMDPTEALWTLIQSQSKSVRKTLTKRLVEWDLQTRLDAARKDIREGKGITVNSKEELKTYLDSL